VNRSRKRIAAIGAAAMVLALAVSACTAAAPKPTVIYKYLTPAPASDSPTPVDTSSLAPTDSTTGTPASAAPTPFVSVAPTPTPSPSPTPIGFGCSGSADTKAFFVSEAKILKFAVYCGHVPAGWNFKTASDSHLKMLTATYAGKSSAKIVIQEGAFCTAGGSACSPHDTSLGSAKFGNLDGGLYTLGPGLGYAIYVNPGTTSGYTATGTNVTQSTFVNIVAALILVPKS
jgi:hypothetical protein